MSSPRLEPWLIPETISSGRSPTNPSSAKRTQSTGVPSVAYPLEPSSNGISSTQRGDRVVMLRAVALRFESGAITWTSSSGILQSSARRAFSPVAWIPSSLVIRTRIRPPILGAELSAPVCDDELGERAEGHACRKHQQAELAMSQLAHRGPDLPDHVEDGAGRDRIEEQLEGLGADVVADHRPQEHGAAAHQPGYGKPTPTRPHVPQGADDAEPLRRVVNRKADDQN